jgi:PAS domain S-box-containing protein
MHPDYREAALSNVARLRDQKTDSHTSERRYLRKRGTIVSVRASVGALRNGDGSIACFVGVTRTFPAANAPRNCCGAKPTF